MIKSLALIACLAASGPALAEAAPRTACAARALKAATDTARDTDGAATMSAFARVEPTKSEEGAGDQFFDASFARAGSGEPLKYHVIMWCKGFKAPLAMAVQPRYD